MEKDTGLNKEKKGNGKDKGIPMPALTYPTLINVKYKPLPKFKGCTNC